MYNPPYDAMEINKKHVYDQGWMAAKRGYKKEDNAYMKPKSAIEEILKEQWLIGFENALKEENANA